MATIVEDSLQEDSLQIDVLAPLLAPAGLAGARPWPRAREDYYRLLLLMDAVAARFRDRITLYIIDPLSVQWVFKVLRHRIRRFPAFLIGQREAYSGWDIEELSRRIARRLAARSP